jgi:hypothetical protein
MLPVLQGQELIPANDLRAGYATQAYAMPAEMITQGPTTDEHRWTQIKAGIHPWSFRPLASGIVFGPMGTGCW